MRMDNYHNLIEKLEKAGWYEGRSIININDITPLQAEYYPKNVLDFICKFGSLKLKSDPIIISNVFTQYETFREIHIKEKLGNIPLEPYVPKLF